MPATISRTTDGRRSAGTSPSSSGTRKATATTTTNPDNETSGITTSGMGNLDDVYNP
jgi:hypothetical protein